MADNINLKWSLVLQAAFRKTASRLITVWHSLFIMITVAQRLLILFQRVDPSPLSRCSNWTDHRFVWRSITLSPFESPWNAIWESSRDSFSTPRKRKVLTKDSRGNVRSPRRDYRIPAAVLLDRVYRRKFSFPCSRVPRSKRRNAKMTSFHLRVLEEGEERRALFNVILVFFVVRPESRSRISGRAISIAQSSVNYTSMRYNV